MFMLGDFDKTATQHQAIPVMKRGNDIAVPPPPQEPSASQLPEQPEAKLPDNLESLPFHQVPYNEKAFDSIDSFEDYLKLPSVTVYVYGKMSTIPAWIYYFNRAMELETAMPDNEEKASQDNHDMESKRAVFDEYVEDSHEEPSETIDRGPDAAQITLPPDLNEKSYWQAPYPMKLLDNVRNLEDLMNLPPAKVYICGTCTNVAAYIFFRERFKTLSEFQSSIPTNTPTMTGNEDLPAMITAAPDSKLPDNLEELEYYYVPYDMRPVEMAKHPEDFRYLPDVIYYHYGRKVVIPAWMYFTNEIGAMASTRPGFDIFDFFNSPATSTSLCPLSLVPRGPVIARRSSIVQPTASRTIDPVITEAPEFKLPDNLAELPFFEVPYDRSLIDKIEKPEDFIGLPAYTGYYYGQKTVVPAWMNFYEKLMEVSKGRTSFIAYEFFATAPPASSSLGPSIVPPAGVNDQPPITGAPQATAAPQTSYDVAAVDSNIDLPDNLHEIPRFEVPYDMSLLDSVETAEDLANLPDAIVFEYGDMRRVPAIQRFAWKLLELVEGSTTSIDPLDIFKPGPDFATDEPQTSTTFSTITRTILSASP
ncbi:hypothetical protein CFO_g5452 [Ceratocystis platani]|uniref:Uncharacterized protein n=1 Tax=Ceratocystis fimbriata f. sp. platani TaxID=88771 RepID=A0A0F8D7V4_CERFI|nr:hypothetical protein CFO_g5452 [Ceratocystis platani]